MLDFDLVSDSPQALYMGELPDHYDEAPADVIVNLCGAMPRLDQPAPVVHHLAMVDALDEALAPSRATLERFLASVHVHAGAQPTYWHCHAGLNRSGLAVAAYLHLYRGQKISDAITHLRGARSPMVLCNNVFERRLRQWYGGPDEQAFQPFDLQTYLKERVRRRERGKL